MYALVILTILYVAQAAGAASSETAERLLTATGPDPAQLWNPEPGAIQEKIDVSGSRCMGASRSDGTGTLTECTGWYYSAGKCTSNSCCQGERDSGYGLHGWCGIGTQDSPGGWAYCTAACNNVPGFDEEDYANLDERVFNIDRHRTISDDFRIRRGQHHCRIDQQGCATDGPGVSYDRGSSYVCQFEIRKAGFLFLTEWDIEGDQSLTIGRAAYNGFQYFHNLEVKAGEMIFFSFSVNSDYPALLRGTGFTVCLSNGRQEPNTIVPAPTLAPADFEILQMRPDNACEIDDNGCVTDGPGNYENDAFCTINVNHPGTVSSEGEFDVEAHSTCNYDYLMITNHGLDAQPGNARKFCGNEGIDEFPVDEYTSIEWKSDRSVVRTGWTLCLEKKDITTTVEPYESIPCDPLIHQCACEPCPPNWVP